MPSQEESFFHQTELAGSLLIPSQQKSQFCAEEQPGQPSALMIVNQINNNTIPTGTQEGKGGEAVEQIKTLREAAGMSQTALAQRIGVKPCSVSIMEQEGKYPDVCRLPLIADALGCSIDALFGRGGPQ